MTRGMADDEPVAGIAAAERALSVLVVEDDPSVRELLVEILREAGHRVRAAEDGAAALERLGPDLDLVVTDLQMPRIDGRELIARLRADARYRTLPALVVTAFAAEAEALREGALTTVLAKPFRIDAFERIVAEVARRPDAR